MLNHQLNAQWGFTPAAVAPTMRYPPDRCSVITAQRRGGMGGEAHVPLLHRTCRSVDWISEQCPRERKRTK